ncbi:hypothetical protein ACFOU2_00085 [Bacillus songklensis]|uniref:Uncharacterized protein n=1 Tax=Bacillus songklensis TaxID=1069116 RepID=A0ABV8AXJ6_9BACI
MDILSNGFGLEKGQKTEPITINYGFMNALFNIELRYGSGEMFPITKHQEQSKQRYRLLHHLVRSDFYTAILLQTVCHANTYEINNVNYASLYDALCAWYEDPISFHDFVISLKKFELLNLIMLSNKRDNGRFDVQLRIQEKDTFFVVAPTIIFTKKFTDLTVSHWKLFFAALLQTGKDKHKLIFRYFDNDKNENMMHKGLKQFLHKQQSSDVKRLIEELLVLPVCNGQPLLARPKDQLTYKKSGRKYHIAYFVLNPELILPHQKGRKYHFPIQPSIKFSRFARFIKHEMEKMGLSEHFLFNFDLLDQVISTLKPKGKVIARHVLHKVKEYVNEHKFLPERLKDFMESISRSRMRAVIENLAREEKIHQWIAPHLKGEAKEHRIYEFINRMSFFAPTTLRKMFRRAYSYLQKYYTTLALYSYTDYCNVEFFERMPMIKEIRQTAARKKVCPVSYAALEREAMDIWHSHPEWEEWEAVKNIGQWLLEEVEKLEAKDTMAYLPDGIVLEDLLLSL